MAHNPHHEHLIAEVSKMFEPMLSRSPQAIYVYLDDEHKFCNKKFAELIGYKSTKEWQENFYPLSDILEKDQKKVIKAYMNASEKFIATTFAVTLVKKSGKKIQANVIMVPFSYQKEVFVIHYITS